MTTQKDEILVTIQYNGSGLRVRSGSFTEAEFRDGLARAGEKLEPDDAIGFRMRPDDPFIEVLTEKQALVVHEGLEVWTGSRKQEIEVTVNNSKVMLMGPVQTVNSIKAAAAAQGAELPDEYVLGIVHGSRDVADLDDNQELFVRSGTRFLAVGHDDDA